MRRCLLGLFMLLDLGCKTISPLGINQGETIPPVTVEGGAGQRAEGCGQSSLPTCAPAAGECKREEYHVTVPKQKVCVSRQAEQGSPQSVAGVQQTTVSHQVLLVPQRVLVPYVQTNGIGTLRVEGAQAQQITTLFGTQGAAGSGQALLAADQSAATGSAETQGAGGKSLPAEDTKNALEAIIALLQKQTQALEAQKKDLEDLSVEVQVLKQWRHNGNR